MTTPSGSNIQALLTQLAQATAQLAQSSNQHNSKLDTLIDQVAQLAQSSNQHNYKLDTLIDQVGHLTEGLLEMRLMIQEQTAATKQQAESFKQQTEVARIQAETVAQLVALVR
ncbi:MAG: hypothetical protein ACP5RH_12290 [Leptodesmis sp.]|uniref:hypothetical protein n=1 Tax=Leptodesmis sp. TaxID=3100501 RepID=UPI003D103E0E